MFNKLRLRLAAEETNLLPLSALGAVCGLLAGMVIIAFRLMYEGVQAAFLPQGNPENYENLPAWLCFTLPLLGAVILGAILQLMPERFRAVGVAHTMDRLAHYQGQLPLINAVAQFFLAAWAIIVGLSVGREGPAVHLGGASGSLLSQWLKLPHNSTRTLVACGAAAAIAASFNTPLAGVIFAMEVVLMEYSMAGFIPVMLAAVIATALMQKVFGHAAVFDIPPLQLASQNELGLIFSLGLVIGVLAFAYGKVMVITTQHSQHWPIFWRLSLAGLLTGTLALGLPQILSIGFDTVNLALNGELMLGLLLALILAKLLITAITLGLGTPGGLIGPTLFIGATAGSAFAQVGQEMIASDAAIYVLLGMAAMMAAVLQAPLAALLALVELTHNPHLLLPGLLIVVTSTLLVGGIAKQPPIFISLLRARGLDYINSPLAQALRRVGVTAAMNTEFAQLPARVQRTEATQALQTRPRWILIRKEEDYLLMPAITLKAALESDPAETLDLLEIPAQRLEIRLIEPRATLQDAHELLRDSEAEALVVYRQERSGHQHIYGILSREEIERYRVH